MEAAIECSDLKRTFVSRGVFGKRQEVHAVDGLTLTVPKGVVFGLLGPNGSGKTTTVRMLSTLLIPTSGQARVLGFDVVTDARRVRGRIGLILGGDRGLYGRLTGEENLNYYAALNHMGKDISHARVKETMDLVGLSAVGARKVEQYSRGMKQRLHIARGLLTDPDVLFLDEPTIGLDPQGARELRQLVPRLVERGKTILLTTHYMIEADTLSSRIAIINRGRIVVSGTPTEIKKKFSRVTILEVLFRQDEVDAVGRLASLPGVVNVSSMVDGPFQRLTVYLTPGTDMRAEVKEVLGEGNVESMVVRDPTLEEAYLSILN